MRRIRTFYLFFNINDYSFFTFRRFIKNVNNSSNYEYRKIEYDRLRNSIYFALQIKTIKFFVNYNSIF